MNNPCVVARAQLWRSYERTACTACRLSFGNVITSGKFKPAQLLVSSTSVHNKLWMRAFTSAPVMRSAVSVSHASRQMFVTRLTGTVQRPLPAKLCIGSFRGTRILLDVVYHRAKFGRAATSHAAGGKKNIDFLSVCLSVCLFVTLVNGP